MRNKAFQINKHAPHTNSAKFHFAVIKVENYTIMIFETIIPIKGAQTLMYISLIVSMFRLYFSHHPDRLV